MYLKYLKIRLYLKINLKMNQLIMDEEFEKLQIFINKLNPDIPIIEITNEHTD